MHLTLIGGTGFIGGRLARTLVHEGHRVTILRRGRTSLDMEGVVSVTCDREDDEALSNALRAADPEVVIDLIAYTAGHARSIAGITEQTGARLVVISSSDVYRNYDGLRRVGTHPPDPTPLEESAPLRETHYPYRGHNLPVEWGDEYEKILVENEARAASPSTVVLRLPAVYGSGDRQRRLRAYVGAMMDEKATIQLDADHARWRWTRGHVDNVAAAIGLAATHEATAGRIYNVGEPEAHTEAEWVRAIGRVIGWPGEVVEKQPLPDGAYDYRYALETDTTRIREELGFREPVAFWDGLRDAVDAELAEIASARTAGH